jgi:hypothetical protein
MFPESREMFPESHEMFPESREMFPESRDNRTSGVWNWNSTKTTMEKPLMSADRLDTVLSCSDFSSTSRRFFSMKRDHTQRALS